MMKSSLAAASLMAAMLFVTACDRASQAEFRRERGDRGYRAAMDDYRAGRLAQAVAGLKKVCADDPANASARFQLACLLQDSEKDFSGAYCAYCEYLLQNPGGDKTKIAKDRLLECERALAGALAGKYGLDSTASGKREVDQVRAELTKAESRGAKLAKELDEAGARVAALEQEVARLKGLIRAEAADEDVARPDDAGAAVAKAMFDSDDSDSPRPDETAAARRLFDDDGSDGGPMIEQAPDAKERRDASRAAAKESEAVAKTERRKNQASRPDVYVVQEGDTLYKIAMQFYGRSSAWRAIREANKATISTDGRVKAGQKIVLPAQ